MDAQTFWKKILGIIKQEITPQNYRTWFSQTTLKSFDGTTLTLIVPSAFIKDQLIKRYEPLIKKSGLEVNGQEITLAYTIDSTMLNKKTQPLPEEEELFELSAIPSVTAPNSSLNPKYTLKNFVVGLTNNLAYAAAQAVVQNPGVSYNPLFIYGPSGVGKTHLMQAIGNEIAATNSSTKIIFASSEKFMNDFVDSIQNKRTTAFRQKYRNCTILLIDDIQFISGKEGFQEEFFHTFNDLHGKNVQIVLTSDRPPGEMQRVESRLVSRFQGGLMVDVQLPDFDTRMAILKAKLSEKGEAMPEECLKLIAENVASNTRELEGKLISLLQAIKLSQAEPTVEFVEKFLGKPQGMKNSHLDHKKVLGGINSYFNIKMHDLTGPRRQKGLVFPRQVAMFIMYEECKMPMEKIGEVLGGRDHTTILHGIEKIRDVAKRDGEVQRMLTEIKQQLSA